MCVNHLTLEIHCRDNLTVKHNKLSWESKDHNNSHYVCFIDNADGYSVISPLSYPPFFHHLQKFFCMMCKHVWIIIIIIQLWKKNMKLWFSLDTLVLITSCSIELSIYCIILVYTNRCDMMLETCENWMESKAMQLLKQGVNFTHCWIQVNNYWWGCAWRTKTLDVSLTMHCH
jgi:hypothetical protein